MNNPNSIELDIPEELNSILSQLTNNKQLFILEAIKVRIEQMKQSTIEKQLIEGYKYSAKHDSELIEDFSQVDLENWDDEY